MTAHDDVTVEDLTIRHVDSREYEYLVVASATVTGPSGPIVLERRYEGLPRHNDVLEDDVADSTDELLDRPDAVHVYTEVFSEGKTAYLGGEHDSWRPPDRSVLVDADSFLDACRNHFHDTVATTYQNAPIG